MEYDDNLTFLTTATQIQIPNSKGYDTIYFINGAADVNEKGEDVYDKVGWADGAGNYIGGAYDSTELKGIIAPGQAFWYKNLNNDEDWTHSGAVPSTDKPKRVDFPNNTFCLRSNLYPVTFNINNAKVDSSEIEPVEYDDNLTFLNTATQIQIPNSKGYDTIYFINGAADVNEKGEDVYDKVGWADGAGNYIGGAYDSTELKGNITVMQGFWVKGVNGASAITFGL